MRIAFLTYDFGEYSIRHANALLEYADIMLVVPQQLAEPYQAIVNPKVDYRPFNKPRMRRPIRQLVRIHWILKQLAEYKPDLIHFQAGHLWFNFALPLLKRRCPIVLTIHDPRQHLGDVGSRKTPQSVMDFGYRRADHVIVHGTQLKEIVHQVVGIDTDRIHMIPHIALGENARKAASLQQTDDNDPSILFFGRIWEYKGLEYLIRAQPKITARFPNAKIVIGGQGEDFQRYRDMMADVSRFEIHNRWISDEERAQMFERATVVVLPYVEATQSGVVPIAYTHSKPVIATRTGGLPDCVEHGKTGLLVPPRSENAIADAIIQLLEDHDLRLAMGQTGKRKLDNECSPEAIAAQTADVYRRALGLATDRADQNEVQLRL